jgi:hypothetical protein
MNDDDYIYPLHTFEIIAAGNRAASPEALATMLREERAGFAETMFRCGFRPSKRGATEYRRHARLVVQRRIRGTA